MVWVAISRSDGSAGCCSTSSSSSVVVRIRGERIVIGVRLGFRLLWLRRRRLAGLPFDFGDGPVRDWLRDPCSIGYPLGCDSVAAEKVIILITFFWPALGEYHPASPHRTHGGRPELGLVQVPPPLMVRDYPFSHLFFGEIVCLDNWFDAEIQAGVEPLPPVEDLPIGQRADRVRATEFGNARFKLRPFITGVIAPLRGTRVTGIFDVCFHALDISLEGDVVVEIVRSAGGGLPAAVVLLWALVVLILALSSTPAPTTLALTPEHDELRVETT